MLKARFTSYAFALLLAAPLLAGCGKKITEPEIHELSAQEALTLAQRAGEGFKDQGVLERSRALLAPIGRTASPLKGTGRVPTEGVQSDSVNTFSYEIQAWDASGRPVDWATAPFESIARLRLAWEYRWNWSSPEWYTRGHSKGAFDVTGLMPSSEVMTWNGSEQNSSEYRWVLPPQEYWGHGIWAVAYQDLVWSKDYLAPYPLGGRVSMQMDESWTIREGASDDTQAYREDVMVTFNGTRYAELVVDGRFRFRLDLETGEVEEQPA
jgi:hypothetical protein